MKAFNIDEAEVFRQIQGDDIDRNMRDYEFSRRYSDWNRVFRNWMRKANSMGSLRRERKLRLVEESTPEERERDIEKWREDMERLGVKV
jgi:hypothetical protein